MKRTCKKAICISWLNMYFSQSSWCILCVQCHFGHKVLFQAVPLRKWCPCPWKVISIEIFKVLHLHLTISSFIQLKIITYLNIGPAPSHRRVIEILDKKKSYIHEVKLQFLTFLYTTFRHPILYNLQKQKALDLIPADNQDHQPDVCDRFKYFMPKYL